MLIIATVGPKTKDRKVLNEIISSGANALRFNFSHGNIEEFDNIIEISRNIDKDINIIQDLSGSKLRVSEELSHIIKIYNKEEVVFCGEDIYRNNLYNESGNKKVIPLNIKNEILISNDLKDISMKDNTMKFNIVRVTKDGIVTRVIKGGIVRCGKGCNIKGFSRSNLKLSDKDKIDLNWGIKKRVNTICQSFVEDAEDINEVRSYIHENADENYKPKIWAKIETIKGIENIDEIVNVVDGIIIARGDAFNAI